MAEQDFSSMQQEAIRRVQEMQKRSQSYVEPEKFTQSSNQTVQHESSEEKSSRKLFSLAGIDIDEEKAMIAMLIYVLYKNKADTKLLLALGYLLL